jgi:hypothetical protein
MLMDVRGREDEIMLPEEAQTGFVRKGEGQVLELKLPSIPTMPSVSSVPSVPDVAPLSAGHARYVPLQ